MIPLERGSEILVRQCDALRNFIANNVDEEMIIRLAEAVERPLIEQGMLLRLVAFIAFASDNDHALHLNRAANYLQLISLIPLAGRSLYMMHRQGVRATIDRAFEAIRANFNEMGRR